MTTIHPAPERVKSSPRSIWRRQFRDVTKSLRAIEQGDTSAGRLHELRIACRRAEAVLRLGRDAVKFRPWRWLRRNLRDLRRGTNALRDDDVLQKWLVANGILWPPLQQELKRCRTLQIDVVTQLARRLRRGDRFVRRARQVDKCFESLDGPAGASDVFGRGLYRELSRFIEVLPSQQMDAGQLHQARIASKRLRYAVEFVAELHPAMDLGELDELLRSVQKHLGSLHDEVVRRRRLEQLKAPQSEPGDLSTSVASGQEKLAAFQAWWQTQPLERILADATAEIVSFMRTGQRDTP